MPRDFRLENLFFGRRHGEPVCWVIDWEDIILWNGMFNATWLLGGCLPVAMCDKEDELLGCYHQALSQAGVERYPLTQCVHDYRCAMLSSIVQGILTITGLASEDVYERTLAGILTERFVMASRRLHLHELLGV